MSVARSLLVGKRYPVRPVLCGEVVGFSGCPQAAAEGKSVGDYCQGALQEVAVLSGLGTVPCALTRPVGRQVEELRRLSTDSEFWDLAPIS
jgi:hypothetical protein